MTPGTPTQPVVILISGHGSNMRTLIEDSRSGDAPYRVDCVVSDKAQAGGLATAQAHGVATRTLIKDGTSDRVTYDDALAAMIDEQAPALVVLAGFMRILSPGFVQRYAGRILNIHPSLLPRYTGLHTHRRALAAGDGVHGATVHFVTEELDGGPAVIQGRVRVKPGDDEGSLAARVHIAEHRIYPLAVRWYCGGRLRCRDTRAWLDGQPLAAPVSIDVDA